MISPAQAAPSGADLASFDPQSGAWIERLLFNRRPWVLLLCLLLTLVLGWQATHLKLNASFEKTVPTHHPYVQNMLAHEADLSGLGNEIGRAHV